MANRKKSYKYTIPVDVTLTQEQRINIGKDMIDAIIKRTKKGLNDKGVKFPKYSKEYKDSMEFKQGGKTSTVNLTLTSEMLESMKYYETVGSVSVGYTEADHGEELMGRVEGNIIGSYGGNPSSKLARPFLGLTDAEKSKIINDNTKEGSTHLADMAEFLAEQVIVEFGDNI